MWSLVFIEKIDMTNLSLLIQSAGLYRYVKVDAVEGKSSSHTRIKMSNGALDLATFQTRKDDASFWLSKSGAPLSVLVFTFDATLPTAYAELKPVLLVRDRVFEDSFAFLLFYYIAQKQLSKTPSARVSST